MTNDRTALRRRRGWLWVAALLAIVVVLSTPAAAQDDSAEAPAAEETADDGPGFAVQPSGPDGPGGRDWFTYTLDPGDVFGDTVAISNLSDRPIRFVIYATDAISVSDTAGFAALKDTEEPVGVGTWIELATNEYTVDPGQRIDVPFSITVPEDAEPGDHAGAILAVDADDAASVDGEEGISFDVLHRLGARVYVRVGGPVAPGLRIDDLTVERDSGSAVIHWEVKNTGNLRLTPTTRVRITGWFGRTVTTVAPQELPELLPGANYVGASIVEGLPSREPLTAHVVVEAEGVRTERSKQFAGYPWLLMSLILILLLGLVAWWRHRRRARTAPRRPSRPEPRVPVSA